MFVNLGYNIVGNRNRYLPNPKGECYEPQTFLERKLFLIRWHQADSHKVLTFLSGLWVDEGIIYAGSRVPGACNLPTPSDWPHSLPAVYHQDSFGREGSLIASLLVCIRSFS